VDYAKPDISPVFERIRVYEKIREKSCPIVPNAFQNEPKSSPFP
jgi:hypothetical protein